MTYTFLTHVHRISHTRKKKKKKRGEPNFQLTQYQIKNPNPKKKKITQKNPATKQQSERNPAKSRQDRNPHLIPHKPGPIFVFHIQAWEEPHRKSSIGDWSCKCEQMGKASAYSPSAKRSESRP